MKVFEPFYDPLDLSACVPGTTTVAELNARAEKDGIYFPLWRSPSESLGSLYLNTRVCSRSFRFGSVGDNTLGLRFALTSGKEVDLGGRVVKNVVGFDLTRFFAGSQGRLGSPVNLVLRLRPLPEVCRELSFSGSFEALEALRMSLMKSAWVHCIDAFDFEIDSKGLNLGLAYSCTRPEEAVFESALRAMAKSCVTINQALPHHNSTPKSQLLVPLSQTLSIARKMQGEFGGRISGYLGHGQLLLDSEAELPVAGTGRHTDLEASVLAGLGSLS